MNFKKRLLCATLLSMLPLTALAADDGALVNGNLPINIQANDLYFDKIKNIAHAMGNVEIIQGNQILLADNAVFHRNDDVMYLKGNVAIKREDGSVFFSDEAKLEKNSKVGIALNFKARVGKKTLLASKSVEMIDDNTMTMDEMIISPCKVCQDNYKSFIPLWQFRAKKATLDKEAERIYYKDAKIDVLGIPMFYSPYLSSPAPGAKRKSGFLPPEFKNSSKTIGFGAKVPYYWNIAPDKDATISPMYTTSGGEFLFGQFRQKVKQGDYTIDGSIGHVQKTTKLGEKVGNKKTLKGHFDIAGSFIFYNDWHTGKLKVKSKRIFDPTKTYLQKYKISKEDRLTTDLSYNVFTEKDYYIARALSFQDLRITHNNKTTPSALPALEAHIERNAGFWNAKAITDLNILNLHRLQGESYKRISFSEGLKVPFKLPYGHLFSSTALVRSDIYQVNKSPIIVKDTQTKLENNKEGGEARIYPELRNEWSWPLYNHINSNLLVIEPVTQFIVAPRMTNLDKVGNEDSQLPEISASNIFSPNRYVGFDKIESGTRLNYGLRANISFEKFKNINAIFGQSYRTHKDANFDRKSGLDKNRSDYVGKVTVQPDEHLFINDAFRLKSDNTKPLRNEFSFEFVYPAWNASVNHLWIDQELLDKDARKYRQEVGVSGAYNFYREWWADASLSSRLGKKIQNDTKKIVSSSAGLRFQADCLYSRFAVSRDHSRSRDLDNGYTYSLTITIPTY